MRWCCPAFKSWYEGAGERGFAILVGRDQNRKPQFVIQHRSIDPGAEDLVKTETPLSFRSISVRGVDRSWRSGTVRMLMLFIERT
jgi:hypothetical protein